MEGADPGAVHPGQRSVRTIRDDPQAVVPGQRPQGLRRRDVAEEVHGYDAAGARRDPLGDTGRVEAPGIRVHVGQDWCGARLPDCVRRRDICQRRHDHLVAGHDAGQIDGKVQRRGPTAGAERPVYADLRRETALERVAEAAARSDLARLQRLHGIGGLVATEIGRRHWKENPRHPRSPFPR